MKKAKRILAVALALFLLAGIVCIGIPMANAAPSTPTDGKIVIKDTTDKIQYKIYKVLELESYVAGKNYSYKVTDDVWREFIATGAGSEYLTFVLDSNGNTTNYVVGRANFAPANNAQAALFAKAAKEYIVEESIPETDHTGSFSNGEYTITGLTHGYYVIISSRGTALAVTTAVSEGVEVVEKNNLPAISKTVQENSTGAWVHENDASIGSEIKYEITVTAADNALDYIVHDQLADGITFIPDSVKVYYIDHSAVNPERVAVAADNYTLKTNGISDGCIFEIEFEQSFCETLAVNDKIVIAYSGYMNSNAGLGTNETTGAVAKNKNTATLLFGDKTIPEAQETRTSNEVITYTFGLNVDKVDGTNTPLSGASFDLSTTMKIEGVDTVVYAKVVDNKLDGWVDAANKTVFTSESFSILGLDAGTYVLTELEAPNGYNKLATPVTINIYADHDGSTMMLELNGIVDGSLSRDYSTGMASFKVKNTSGTILPSTGGMGTTVFYVVGVILVLGAVALLATKKRVNSK